MYFLVLFLYYFVPAQIMLYLYYSCINVGKAAGQKGRPEALGQGSGGRPGMVIMFWFDAGKGRGGGWPDG